MCAAVQGTDGSLILASLDQRRRQDRAAAAVAVAEVTGGRCTPALQQSSPRTVLLSWWDHAVVHGHTPGWEASLHRLVGRDQHGLLERWLDHIL